MENGKAKEPKEPNPIEPWWFWGCSKESYLDSFDRNSYSDIILEEDSKENQEIWEAIETGKLPI